jgi:DNA-directed RNA polymerase subunit M/transcription elongation factor TFIIS
MLKFCKHCDYSLTLEINKDDENTLYYSCATCGYKEKEEKGGLIMETAVQEKASDSYKVYLNEFTIKDPTLPHIKNIPCPNEACTGKADPDVIYIKYDAAALKYLYICTHCKTHWRSR